MMAAEAIRHRGARTALGVLGVVVVLLALAQLLLPALAAKRISDRITRYGTVKSASISALPAVELLWGHADSATVHAGTLTITPAQLTALLWEARDVQRMTVTADSVVLRMPSLPNGLTLSDVRMEKHGSAVQTSATLTQRQLDQAFPTGFRVEPLASGDGQVEARVSGGLFGVQTSITALVKPLDGRLVAEPRGLPFAGLATVTLFSEAHLKVLSVGVLVQRRQPLTYKLSLNAILR